MKSLTILVLVVGARVVWAQSQTDLIALRQIVVASEDLAVEIHQLAASGTAFDVLAAERSLDGFSAARGGYLGQISPADLRPEFRDAVADLAPGEISLPVEVSGAFYVFQMVSHVEARWMDLDEAGANALSLGQSDRAARYFEEALELAETYAPDSPQLLRSLDGLAQAYQSLDRAGGAAALYRRALALVDDLSGSRLERAQLLRGLGRALAAQGQFDEAEGLYLEARTIRQEALGTDHPEIVGVQLDLADLYGAAGRFVEAVALYDESQTILRESLGPDDPTMIASEARRVALNEELIAALLDGLSTIVGLAEFKDREFGRAVTAVQELIPLVPLTERSYVQMKDVLLEVGLSAETEAVLRLGLAKFPDSRILRIYLADLMAGTGRTEAALGVLEEAAALPRPDGLDEATDRQQQGVIFQRIGDIQLALTHPDEAVVAYRRSLEIDPGTAGGRVKLGKAYFSSNRVDEALAEYERAVQENPQDHEAYLNVAEAHLALGAWESAARTARQAIELGTTDSRSLYLLGTALVRTGNRDAGQEPLREFADVEAEFREIEHRNREVDAISLAAIGALRDGNGDAAIQTLQEGIAAYPDAGRLYMNLAGVESRLGRHEAAVETYQEMLERGVGRRFLIHKSLAEEFDTLGDPERSERHRQIYRDTREAELIVYAPE